MTIKQITGKPIPKTISHSRLTLMTCACLGLINLTSSPIAWADNQSLTYYGEGLPGVILDLNGQYNTITIDYDPTDPLKQSLLRTGLHNERSITGSIIDVKNGEIEESIFNGFAYDNGESDAFTVESHHNQVTIHNAIIGQQVIAGSANSRYLHDVWSHDNQLTIYNGQIGLYAIAGYAELTQAGNGEVNHNYLLVHNGQFADNVVAGYVKSIQLNDAETIKLLAHHNQIDIYGGTYRMEVAGGIADYSSASGTAIVQSEDNQVNFYAGQAESVYGGHSESGSMTSGTIQALRNQVVVNGETSQINEIAGGYSDNFGTGSAHSDDNRVQFLAGTNNQSIIGGYATSSRGDASAQYNQVVISGGQVNNVFGGFADSSSPDHIAQASYNHVTLTGGVVKGDIFGGVANSHDGEEGNYDTQIAFAHHNVVALSAEVRLDPSVNLYGGFTTNSTPESDVISGNTLRFGARPVTLHSVNNFDNYQFILQGQVVNGDTLIKVDTPVNIDNATIQVVGIDGNSQLREGDGVTLISQTTGTAYLVGNTLSIGTARIVDVDVTMQNDAVIANLLAGQSSGSKYGEANPQTKAYSEGRLAGLVFTNQGADLIAEQAMASVVALMKDDSDYQSFGVISGGDSRYKTGSHVDVKGVSLAVGIAKNVTANYTLGGFFEAGWGNYDSYNSFANLASIKGDGNVQYRGVGLLTRYQFNSPFYLDGAIRVGKVKTDFDSNDFGTQGGVNGHYDASSLYYGAHLGLGYLWQLSEQFNLDLHTRYLWTHLNGDDVDTRVNDKLAFDSIDSHRLNSGGKLNYQITPELTTIVGLAYEYEFDGKATGTIEGLHLAEPETKGGSGIGELGLRYKPEAVTTLAVDVRVQGYVGNREGVTGGLYLNYTF